MLCMDSVVFRYGQGRPATVDQVSFNVKPGEFVAIMGANGSGKSTLARLLNGLLKPESGSVLVEGLDTASLQDIWNIRAKVGMVFQNPENQMVAPTVADDIAFGLENLGIELQEMRQRVDNALRFLGLEKYADFPPSRLSGGEKQRVAIAGILAMQPQYLVLDEASSMLDPQSRKELLNSVKNLQSQGIGIILITQHTEEVIEADTLLVLHKGKVVLSGKPSKVLATDPDELRKFGVATTAMGRLACKLRARGLELNPEILRVEEMVKALC